MDCKICRTEAEVKFNATILNKYNIEYFACPNCKFIQTEEPYWLEEAYQNSINDFDTGIMQRNMNLSRKTALFIYFFLDKKSRFLDFAGGYGVFTRLMRDIGFDYYWYDLYSENLLAKKFEYTAGKVELITAFEAFEHFVEPMAEIEKMLEISDSILISTLIYDGSNIPIPGEWWYYGLEHGQHVSFYTRETFEYIARQYKLNYYCIAQDLHLLTKKKLNLYQVKVILKADKLGLFSYVKRHLKSMTQTDMEQLINLSLKSR